MYLGITTILRASFTFSDYFSPWGCSVITWLDLPWPGFCLEHSDRTLPVQQDKAAMTFSNYGTSLLLDQLNLEKFCALLYLQNAGPLYLSHWHDCTGQWGVTAVEQHQLGHAVHDSVPRLPGRRFGRLPAQLTGTLATTTTFPTDSESSERNDLWPPTIGDLLP